MSVSILLLLGFAEKSRSGLSGKQGIGHRRFSALLPPLTPRACVRLDVPRHVLCTPKLVSPPNPSMRFVSAHFRAETGRRRGPCQVKTSRQASQQLRRHFVAVKAFAFACPRVSGRVGPFLRSQYCVHRKRSKTAAVSLTAVEQTLGSLIGGANPLFNGGVGHQFKRIKRQSAQGCGEQRSVSRLAQPWACLSHTTSCR
jgi:hypothetical protein